MSNVDAIKTVAVLGAGTMGNGIAHVFARAGYKVILRDVERHGQKAAVYAPPEDEGRAREIIREIVEGAPPV